MTSGRDIKVHVVYYNTEPLTDSTLYSGNEGGRCGGEVELETCLRDLAEAGKGRFHHFRVSGHCEGDDISELMEEIFQATEYLEEGKRILSDYREFCRRVSEGLHGIDHKFKGLGQNTLLIVSCM